MAVAQLGFVRPMKSHIHICSLALFCSVALCLVGCANSRYAIFGCVSARASLEKGAPVLYSALTIEPPTNKPAPPFCLRFPNGQVVQLSALTSVIVKDYGYTNGFEFREKDLDDLQVHGHGASFRFLNDKLVSIYLTSGAVGISREDAKQFYFLPLTLDDLEHLFGHPDAINSGIEW